MGSSMLGHEISLQHTLFSHFFWKRNRGRFQLICFGFIVCIDDQVLDELVEFALR
jgi:hypothetical protein